MRALRIFLFAVALSIVPASASAVNIRLGLGANYWFVKSGLFDVTLAEDGRIVGPLYIGGRVGAALVTGPETAGIPIDLLIGVVFADGLIYIEASGGPWLIFNRGDLLRGHGALGFGFNKGIFFVGLEVGYLEPNAIIGLQLGLRF